jgi:hypothetical protein
MQYKVGQTLPSAVGLNPNQPPYVLNNVPTVTANLSSSQINVLPLKVSIIDHTRPLRNIFPKDSYTTKTKFDENLVIMN